MTRTTICLHESVLKRAKRIAHERQITLGETITELLNKGLQQEAHTAVGNRKPFSLPSFSMGTPFVALEDKEALMSVMEKRPL
ncbi:MAG: hypothetical protein PHC61_09525 [Chitinivibrionales bacterium]|nr:hypothetical protein [Chitinivibrionales bacterium]